MSIARLAGEAGRVQVKQAVGPAGVAGPSAVARPGIGGPGGQANAGGAGTTPARDERFELLTKYIPTETITLFVAVVSGMQAISKLNPMFVASPWVAYAAFAVLTPLIVLVLAYGAYKEAARTSGVAKPPAFKAPVFRMVAAFFAFLVWALAVPGVAPDPTLQIAAGVGALFVSTGLSLVQKAFDF